LRARRGLSRQAAWREAAEKAWFPTAVRWLLHYEQVVPWSFIRALTE